MGKGQRYYFSRYFGELTTRYLTLKNDKKFTESEREHFTEIYNLLREIESVYEGVRRPLILRPYGEPEPDRGRIP